MVIVCFYGLLKFVHWACLLCWQVPFESTVKQVLQQLKNIAKGDYTAPTTTPNTEKRKLGNIVFAAVNIPVTEIQSLLHNVSVCFVCFSDELFLQYSIVHCMVSVKVVELYLSLVFCMHVVYICVVFRQYWILPPPYAECNFCQHLAC